MPLIFCLFSINLNIWSDRCEHFDLLYVVLTNVSLNQYQYTTWSTYVKLLSLQQKMITKLSETLIVCFKVLRQRLTSDVSHDKRNLY